MWLFTLALITLARMSFVGAFGVAGDATTHITSTARSMHRVKNLVEVTNQNDDCCNPRRFFFVSVACIACSSLSILFAPKIAMGTDEDGVPSDNNKLCKPPKNILTKLSDTRTQIDMAVQASSVQAWSSAAEMVNDPLLDTTSLSGLFDSCGTPSAVTQQIAADVFEAIDVMRNKLNGPDKLSTEEAMAVMKYGTSARSGIDKIFGL